LTNGCANGTRKGDEQQCHEASESPQQPMSELSRRQFLQTGLGALAGGALLSSCSFTPDPLVVRG
jgi:hypothetical protein